MSAKVYVGNISPDISDEELRGCFSPYGSLHDCVVMKDRETGESHAYVTFGSREQACVAIAAFDNRVSDLDGRGWRVSLTNLKSTEGGWELGQNSGGIVQAAETYGGEVGSQRNESTEEHGSGRVQLSDEHSDEDYGKVVVIKNKDLSDSYEQLPSESFADISRKRSPTKDRGFWSTEGLDGREGYTQQALPDENPRMQPPVQKADVKATQEKTDPSPGNATNEGDETGLVAAGFQAAYNNIFLLLLLLVGFPLPESLRHRKRAHSETSSDSDRESTLPMESHGSMDTMTSDLSKQSGYPTVISQTATSQLFTILANDEVLCASFRAAIKYETINRVRLEHNFRRFLKACSRELGQEAHYSIEHFAARLVHFKATYLAKAVVEKHWCQIHEQESSKKPRPVHPKTQDVLLDSEKENEDKTLDESTSDDLEKLQEFFCGSNALQTLRIDLQKFILRSEKSERHLKPSHNMAGQIHTQQRSKGLQHGQPWNVIPQHIRGLSYKLYKLPSQLRSTKPKCGPGMQRIEWKCICGASGSGDVREIEATGVARLKAQMKRCTGAITDSNAKSSGITSLAFQNLPSWASLRDVVQGFRRPSQAGPSLPTHRPSALSISMGTQTSSSPPAQDQLILMSCILNGYARKSLFQDDISELGSDRNLMEFLKARYRERRGKFRSALSLRKVVGIHFTHFFISVSKNVEVRHHAICCTEQLCECLPPTDLVAPGGSDPQYLYMPVPPATSPPYVPDYLLHLFESPSCIDECEKEVFERLPKRTKGVLAGKAGHRAKGWGIFYEEGWDLLKLGWLVFLVIFLGSLLFGVLWAVLKKDIQGAFGISAWWVTIGGSTLALCAIQSSRL